MKEWKFRPLIKILKLCLSNISGTSLGKTLQTGISSSRESQGISPNWCEKRTILTSIDQLRKRRSARFSKI